MIHHELTKNYAKTDKDDEYGRHFRRSRYDTMYRKTDTEKSRYRYRRYFSVLSDYKHSSILNPVFDGFGFQYFHVFKDKYITHNTQLTVKSVSTR